MLMGWNSHYPPQAGAEGLSSVPSRARNSGDHFRGSFIRRLLFWVFLAKHTDTASARWINRQTRGRYFKYCAGWMVSMDWIVVCFWKVDPRTKSELGSSAAPPPPSLFLPKALCCAQSRTHAIQPSVLLCWHSQSHSLLSQLSGLCTRYAFLLGSWCSIPQSRGSRHPHKKKQGLLASQRSGLPTMALINQLPFTFPGSFLLGFQGHLHLRGLKMFARHSRLCPLPPPTLPRLPYTILRAWAL